MMRIFRLFFGFWLLGLGFTPMQAQRSYASQSVLATGNWYKLGLVQDGMYKIDLTLLSNLGVSGTNISSNTIRLYGRQGFQIPEANQIARPDDLTELAIEVMDGGDGVLNGQDYILFYGQSPHKWLKDSINQRFQHQKNPYGDTTFVYLTLGGLGRRVEIAANANPTVNVSTYWERHFYENDQTNFLNSGREWFGEGFSMVAGQTTRNFTVNLPNLLSNSNAFITSSMAARSVGSVPTFTVQVNGQTRQQINLAAISGGFLDAFATSTMQTNTFAVPGTNLSLSYAFQAGNSNAQGWLNWFEIQGPASLQMGSLTQLLFRDWSSVGANAIAGFTLNGANATTQVWEITDPFQPVRMNSTVNGTQLRFNRDASRLREYIAFQTAGLLTPVALGRINNQNLHNITAADYLIITHPSLLAEANRLAAFHREKYRYRVNVIQTDQLYHEFGGGMADPAAIRDFVKMYYDRLPSDRPKYLLLFGAGSFDYKNRIPYNTNLVPVYQSPNALDPLISHVSDDFFGLLDDADDVALTSPPSLLDIGIGRIPAHNIAEAKVMVDKIIRYHSANALGDWRTNLVFVADDRDGNLHLNDAESMTTISNNTNPIFQPKKIYLDAFPQVSGSSGSRYPAVNDAIVNQLFNGALYYNYTGHGSYQRLAEEAVFSQDEVRRLRNADKLPLFLTATCDFAPHDDPTKSSLGDQVLMGNENGAIALMTTTRVVFAYSNRIMNENYLRIALKPDANGIYPTLGDAVRIAKNQTYQGFGDVLNNRKFTLLGDPAMRLGFPQYQIRLTKLNGNSLTNNATLKALERYTFEGEIVNASGQIINDFNGQLTPVVYDKAQEVKTRGNDPASPVTSFLAQTSVLFKGNSTVTNGKFQFSFVVPKDISYQSGKGRISLYAQNNLTDAAGVNTDLFIGGTAAAVNPDNTGPTIRAWLNDTLFRSGGLTNNSPVLLLDLFDQSGINTSGTGIGHDMVLVIDGDEKNSIVLNGFYTAAPNSFQRGFVRFPMPVLSEGKHSLRIKAWDVVNNSSEITITCWVGKSGQLQLAKVMNFPNPFRYTTTFSFEHNRPERDLQVQLAVYNTQGRLVKQINQQVRSAGTRSVQIQWNGTDDQGKKLGSGTYFYRIIVQENDEQAGTTGQLILF